MEKRVLSQKIIAPTDVKNEIVKREGPVAVIAIKPFADAQADIDRDAVTDVITLLASGKIEDVSSDLFSSLDLTEQELTIARALTTIYAFDYIPLSTNDAWLELFYSHFPEGYDFLPELMTGDLVLGEWRIYVVSVEDREVNSDSFDKFIVKMRGGIRAFFGFVKSSLPEDFSDWTKEEKIRFFRSGCNGEYSHSAAFGILHASTSRELGKSICEFLAQSGRLREPYLSASGGRVLIH